MRILNLYRYHGVGGVIDTTILLDAPHEVRSRLIADEGCVLSNGVETVDVIDVNSTDVGAWVEIPKPVEAEGGEDDGGSD